MAVVLAIYPSPALCQTASSALFSLELNVPSEKGLDVVFIPEGFTPDEMDRFHQTVEAYRQYLLSIKPFSEYRQWINVWRIDTTEDFDSKRPDPAIPRLLTVNSSRVKQFVEDIADFDLDSSGLDDFVIVLVDDPTYGGSGDFDVAVAYTGIFGKEVMTHELGHSFGHLGDEYVLNNFDLPAGVDIPYPNIDWDGTKWKDVPNTGAYQGAWYLNLVRPTNASCLMRTLSYAGFCPVCTIALASRLEYYSGNLVLLEVSGDPEVKVIVDGASIFSDQGRCSLLVRKGAHTVELQDKRASSDWARYMLTWGDGANSTRRTVNITSDTALNFTCPLQFALRINSQYDIPVSFAGEGWYEKGSIAAISVGKSSVIDGKTKYVFGGWSGSGGAFFNEPTFSMAVNQPMTLTANWNRQYFLDLATEYGSAEGSGWYNEGAVAKASITQDNITQGLTRYLFLGWGDYGNENEISVLMDLPKSIVSTWKRQFYLNLTTDYGSAKGSGWYDEGSVATVSIGADNITQALIRHVFVGWSGYSDETEISVLMDIPKSIASTWKTQYYVELITDYGLAEGSGWYNEGSTASLSIETESLPAEGFLGFVGVKHVFKGWAGVYGEAPEWSLFVNSPKTIVAEWNTDYTTLFIYIIVSLSAIAAVLVLTVIRKRSRKQTADSRT
jgi:uncharacterized repeat protein (TIGR02543 family)